MSDFNDAELMGKVVEYDNSIGSIVDEDKNKYKFVGYGMDVKVGDTVKFKPEVKEDETVAFFVKPYDLKRTFTKVK